MPHFLQIAYSFASHVTTFAAALGIMTALVAWWFKWVAMPKIKNWIKVNILDPLAAAKADTAAVKQDTAAVKKDVAAVKVATTVNGHSQDEPTLRDDMSDIKKHLAKQDRARVSDRKALTTLTRRVTSHLLDAEAERAQVALLVAQVAELKAAQRR